MGETDSKDDVTGQVFKGLVYGFRKALFVAMTDSTWKCVQAFTRRLSFASKES